MAHETFGIDQWVVGLIVCLLTAAVILGGVKSIARVCTVLVPFMALLYVLGCIIILFVNRDYVWPAVQLIVDAAFNPSAAGGGLVGAAVCSPTRVVWVRHPSSLLLPRRAILSVRRWSAVREPSGTPSSSVR
jgi:AGCS family alanine or glycine:cation symporter